MKKSAILVLIFLIIVCACAFSFAGCNRAVAVSGNWVGYIENNGAVQLYLSFHSTNKAKLTIRTATDGKSEIEEKALDGIVRKRFAGPFKICDMFSSDAELRFSSKGSRLTFEEGYNKTYLFKKTEMSEAEWREKSFTRLIGSAQIYKPYFFECDDARLLNADDAASKIDSLKNKVYVGFEDSQISLSGKQPAAIYCAIIKDYGENGALNVKGVKANLKRKGDSDELDADFQIADSALYYDAQILSLRTDEDFKFEATEALPEESLSGVVLFKNADMFFDLYTNDLSYNFMFTDLTEQNISDLIDGRITWDEIADMIFKKGASD